jgi:hypothetical protein
MQRSFTVDKIINTQGKTISFTGGRYMSNTPSSAARKAFSQAYRVIRQQSNIRPRILDIHIRETTQGTSNKIFKYRITRSRTIAKIQPKDEPIFFTWVTKVKAI